MNGEPEYDNQARAMVAQMLADAERECPPKPGNPQLAWVRFVNQQDRTDLNVEDTLDRMYAAMREDAARIWGAGWPRSEVSDPLWDERKRCAQRMQGAFQEADDWAQESEKWRARWAYTAGVLLLSVLGWLLLLARCWAK